MAGDAIRDSTGDLVDDVLTDGGDDAAHDGPGHSRGHTGSDARGDTAFNTVMDTSTHARCNAPLHHVLHGTLLALAGAIVRVCLSRQLLDPTLRRLCGLCGCHLVGDRRVDGGSFLGPRLHRCD